MPVIKIKFKDHLLGEFLLFKGKSLTIGRLESNDIPIENLAVSGQHAKISTVGDGFLLTDLQSKNGTSVNREPVASHWLRPGDIITIGKHTLIFEYRPGEALPVMEAEGNRKVPLRDEPPVTADPSELDAAAAQPAVESKGVKGVLSFLAGGKGEILCGERPVTIGREPSSDILINGIAIGKTAATISRRGSDFFLACGGGLTKPRVNGETVKDEVQLKEFDHILIGPVKLQFITRL
jgi:pSer/pThr/pTyr-binding forkhead associated (FHA) protein